MIPTARVISIGSLSCHPLWNESRPVRTGHATTTLVEGDGVCMVIDPGLPAAVVAARMSERSPHHARDVTHVFLTTITDETMRGLGAFPNASWLAYATDIAAARATLHEELEHAAGHPEDGAYEPMKQRLSLIERLTAAEDTIAPGIDLFPLPGVTSGCCGVLLAQPTRTVLITGDAVATREHLEEGQVLPTAHDRTQAMESFKEAIEIADVIVPGRDNILLNPARQR